MITLKIDKEILIQIQKNQVSTPLKSSCLIRLTSVVQGNSVEVEAEVQELTNVYILTISNPINGIMSNALLEIYDAEKLAFSAESFIVESI